MNFKIKKPNDNYFLWKSKQPSRDKLISEKKVCGYCGREISANSLYEYGTIAFCSRDHYEMNERTKKLMD